MARIDDILFPDTHPVVVIAPMAGVTDTCFRSLCRDFGARFIVAEMLTSDTRLWHTDKSQRRRVVADEPGPRWVQIAGAEPTMLAEAARRCADEGADIIDINMGCPAKKVCQRAAGSALLADETLVGRILESVVAAVDVPVTLKYRLGPDPDHLNAVPVARIAAASGIQLLSLHARTRQCRFSGAVNYAAVAEVCAASTLPVLANGDICSAADARQVLAQTGARGVMLGRAVQGKPWLAQHIALELAGAAPLAPPAEADLLARLARHVSELEALYGTHRIARKHIGWYLDANRRDAATLKATFNRLESLQAQQQFLDSLQQQLAA